MHEPAPVALASRTAPLGRLLRWRVLSIVAFLALMLGLLATAVFALFVPARPVTGLPDDPDVAAARALVHGTLAIPLGPLRFACALTGPAAVADLGHAATAADVARARAADARLARCKAARDPRVVAARAALALAARRHADAERLARAALDRAPRLDEARLALGAALAMEAETTPEPLRARGLLLQAIAQLYAVDPAGTVAREALYDRALLESAVGRTAEAAAAAHAYLALDPAGPWAAPMRALAAGKSDTGASLP